MIENATTKNVRAVKAALVLKGLNLAQWARNHGYPTTTVWQAVHGVRSGKISKEIRKALNVTTS